MSTSNSLSIPSVLHPHEGFRPRLSCELPETQDSCTHTSTHARTHAHTRAHTHTHNTHSADAAATGRRPRRRFRRGHHLHQPISSSPLHLRAQTRPRTHRRSQASTQLRYVDESAGETGMALTPNRYLSPPIFASICVLTLI